MTNLDGTMGLLRLAARRDRVRLPIWVVSVVGITYVSGLSIPATFPSQQSMDSYGASVSGSPALIAMTGPPDRRGHPAGHRDEPGGTDGPDRAWPWSRC